MAERLVPLAQWRVTITDNRGVDVGPYIVHAHSETEARARGRYFYGRSAPRGQYAVTVHAEQEQGRPS